MGDTNVVTETRRCPSCGGLNPAAADWCGQCLRRFTPPPPPPPAVGGAKAKAKASDPAAPVAVTDDGITWRCRMCEHVNDLAASTCGVCGSPFAATVYGPEAEPEPRDANTAALLSLFLPGAGHGYLGRWPEAIARAVLSLFVVAVALVGAFADGVPGSLLLAGMFGLAAFALWAGAAHDAYRSARGEDDLVILRGRRYMYVTFALMGVLMMGLVVAFVSAA